MSDVWGRRRVILVTGLVHSLANLAAWQCGGVAVLVAARCLLYCTVLCYRTVLYYCIAGACCTGLYYCTVLYYCTAGACCTGLYYCTVLYCTAV